jgi:hypothetical protein
MTIDGRPSYATYASLKGALLALSTSEVGHRYELFNGDRRVFTFGIHAAQARDRGEERKRR